MKSYSQDHRPMRLHVPSLADNRLLLVGVEGEEAISQLFRFTLDVRAARSEDLDFDELLGKELRVDAFDAAGGLTRQFHGIVAEVGETGRDRSFVRLQIEMAPRLWLLTQTLRSRIFQEMTVVEIVEKVLKEHSVPLKFRLGDSYPVRNYTTQYQESDFEFMSRLLEDHGIHYYFENDAEGSRVVFADQSTSAPAILESRPIEYREADDGVVEKFHIHEWRPKVRLRPGKFLTRDHSFQLPNKPLESRDSLANRVAFGAQERRLSVSACESLLQYEYPGDYAKLFDAGDQKQSLDERIANERERTIRVRAQEQACRGIEIVGLSNCPALSPGYQFKLSGIGKGDGGYFITGAYHSLRMPEFHAETHESTAYECSFECLPAGLPFRPRRDTPQPAIHGSQTATVVGGPEGEVAIDKFGRIKVHFHWDLEGARDGKDSCWIRVASPWAGQGWGMVSHPRVGQEVVVDFQEGDPDRPLVIGSVYNPEQPNPYVVPDRRNETCIKSRTIGGAAGDFHGLSLNDAKGAELFRLRSQKDMLVEVKNNHHLAIPNAQTNIAGSLSYAQTGGLLSRQYQADPDDGNGWQGVKVGAGLAYKVDTTFGGYSNLVIGFATQQYVGAFHRIFVSPLAILGAVPLPGFSALAGMLGKSEISHGGETMMVYGPRFLVNHGPKKERDAPLKDSKLLAAIAATHAAATIANVLTPGLINCWDIGVWKLAVLLTESAETLILGLLTAAEELAGEVADLEVESARIEESTKSSINPSPGLILVSDQEDVDERLLVVDDLDVESKMVIAEIQAYEDTLKWSSKKKTSGQKKSVAGTSRECVTGQYIVTATDDIQMSSNRSFALASKDGFKLEVVDDWFSQADGPDGSDSGSEEELRFDLREKQAPNIYLQRLEVGPNNGLMFSSSTIDTKEQVCVFRANQSLVESVVKKKNGVVSSSTKLTPKQFKVKAPAISLMENENYNSVEIDKKQVTIMATSILLKDESGANSIEVNDKGLFFNGKKISEEAMVSKTTKTPMQRHSTQ